MRSQARQTLTLFIIVLILGITVQGAYALEISGPQVVNVTGSEARVLWDTDEPANSTVRYGINNYNSVQSDPDLVLSHQMLLAGLNQSAIYDLQIESANQNGTAVRSGLTFVTRTDVDVEPTAVNSSVETGESMEDLPPKISTDFITLTGTTEPGATVRVFINSDRFPAQILENGGFSVTAGPDGSFSATVKLYETVFKGVLGYNEITIKITDPSGNTLEKKRTIIIDVTSPRIYLSDIKEVRTTSEIPVIGSLSEEGTLKAIIDNSTVIDINVTEKKFNATVDVGSGEHNLTLEATDTAGNAAVQNFEIRVDNTLCRLNLDEEVFEENQHFSIATISGNTTEPKCRIQIFNVGNNNTISIEKVQEKGIQEYIAEFEIGVGGAIVGRAKEINSGEDAEFSTQIALSQAYAQRAPGSVQQPDLLEVSPNRLLFVVIDEAGNEHTEERTIQFEPGSMMWKPGRIQTIPNTVYSNNLMAERSTGVPVSVLYDLYYIGPQTEPLRNIRATATLEGGKYDNEYVSVEETKSFFHEDENRLFVLTKLRVLPITKSLEEVKKDLGEKEIGNTGTGLQFDFSMKTMVSYQLGQASMNEPVFIQHAVGLETPFDYTNFLTPEMINDTLELLDDWIEFLEDATKFAEEATLALTAGCVGSTLLSYVAGGASPENMKRTYMICDRVWCPTIPPDCEDMQKVVTDKRGEKYVYDPEKESYFNVDDVKRNEPVPEVEGSVTFVSQHEDMTTQYRYVSREKAVVSGQPVCPPGQNAIEIRTVNASKRPLLLQKPGSAAGTQLYEAGSVRYACTSLSRGEYGQASAKSASVGCYSEGPPGFHETKCFPDNADNVNDDGQVNPYDDIFISLRCGCVSGVRGHLANFLRVSNGMKKCLQQAMIGEVRGGYCERLFAQFVCDLITWAIKKIVGTGRYGSLDSGEGAVFRGDFQEVNERLQARYSTLIQNQYGLTSMQLVHKACVGAITGDWSDLRNVFQQATRVAVAPVIGPMIPESRFAAWDPFTGEAAINYYLTLGILSGGQRVSGSLKILCDKSKPGGEYCPPGAPTLIYEEGIFVDVDQSLERNFFYTDEHAKYWANVAVLDLTYKVGDEVKRKVKEEKIIRKSPFIAQCHFQAVPPGIVCETIAGGLQAIEFSKAGFTPSVTNYYPGNSVLVSSLVSAVSPLAGEIEEAAVPELYLAYNLKKPDSQVVTNRNDRDQLQKFRIDVQDFRGVHVAELLRFGEAVGGPEKNLVWEGSKIMLSRLGFREEIMIDPGETRTFSAELISPPDSAGVKRPITYLELHHAFGVDKSIRCTQRGYSMECTYDAESGSEPFATGTISYTIEAASMDESAVINADDTRGTSLGKPTEQRIARAGADAEAGPAEEYPAGRYELNLTLFHDVDGNGVIDADDAPVPYGNKKVQSHLLSFNFARTPPSGCTTAPKVEIIYPRPDTYVTKDLKSIDVKEGGILFSLWDDCNRIESVALYDQKSYMAALDEAKTNRELTEPYQTYMIAELSDNAQPNSQGLYMIKGRLQYNYEANDAFALVLRAIDDAGRIGEARVPVIASPGAVE